jgi:hypothetical protein
MVSTRKTKVVGEEELSRTTTRRQKKKRQFEGKVHLKQKTFEHYTHLF